MKKKKSKILIIVISVCIIMLVASSIYVYFRFYKLKATLKNANSSEVLSGFGTNTKGGNYGKKVYVSSLDDSGPGTLREALQNGNNTNIEFSVGGTINLKSPLDIRNISYITINGLSASTPGITIVGHNLSFRGSHDIIIQGIRIRDSIDNGFVVWEHSYNVVIDHCSVANSGQVAPPAAPPPGDKNIDITEDTHDVTVSWSIIGDSRSDSFARKTKAMLIANIKETAVTNVSIHNNLIINDSQRNPQVSTEGLVDIRNNVIENWAAYGIRMRLGAYGNIVNNYYASQQHPNLAIILAADSEGAGAGPVYINGNSGPKGYDVNSQSTAKKEYPVANVPTSSAIEAKSKILSSAGVFPRDSVDNILVQDAEKN